MELEVPRPEEEMELRSDIADIVESDPERNAMEKETSFNILGDEKFIRIFTAKPTMVKSLLEHDYAVITTLIGRSADESYSEVSIDEGDWSSLPLEVVHSLSAHMPVGSLTVKGSPRSTHTHSNIINTPSDVAAVSEAFADD